MDDKTVSIFEKQIQDFIERKRPPKEMRDRVDLSYNFDGRTLDIFEIREVWGWQHQKVNSPIARARFVQSSKHWKLYRMKASGKWVAYGPRPEVETLREVLEEIEEDPHDCFWG